jgi:beta-mannanase
VARIDAEVSSRMTTLRARRSVTPRVGAWSAAMISPTIASVSKSDSQRRSCFHSALASRCSRTRFHRLENGTSKRRRRIFKR